jgi:hypothetical protein
MPVKSNYPQMRVPLTFKERVALLAQQRGQTYTQVLREFCIDIDRIYFTPAAGTAQKTKKENDNG